MRGRGFVHQEEAGEDDRGGGGPEPGTGHAQESWEHENQPLHFNINKVTELWWLVVVVADGIHYNVSPF